jgi:hypothetical protein
MKNYKHKPNGTAYAGLNRNKRQFVQAVKMMAPGNKFIADVARRVPQDMLPAVAGVAAFELAATLDLLCKSWRLRRPLESAHSLRGRRREAAGFTRQGSRNQMGVNHELRAGGVAPNDECQTRTSGWPPNDERSPKA